MFGRKWNLDDYRGDILLFCALLGAREWTPSPKALAFLRGVQRNYRRVGLADAPDGYRALAAACIWRACCCPGHIQFVAAGSTKNGKSWVRFLKTVASESVDMIREKLLFADDDSSIMTPYSDEPVLAVLGPEHLIGFSKIRNGRPTVLAVPNVDWVPLEQMGPLASFVSGQDDQWLVLSPSKK